MNVCCLTDRLSHFSRLAIATGAVALMLGGHAASVNADVIYVTTNFGDYQDGAIVDLSGTTAMSVEQLLGVLITPSRSAVRSAFGNPGYPVGDADNPGDRAGYISSNWIPNVSCDAPTMVLNFSKDVVGFGVTFTHFVSSIDACAGLELPARLRAYDGLDGTGSLLGTVFSSGLIPEDGRTVDFVGVISAERNIRSVVLDGTGTLRTFGVDAYGMTISVPEPGIGAMIIALALSILARRKW